MKSNLKFLHILCTCMAALPLVCGACRSSGQITADQEQFVRPQKFALSTERLITDYDGMQQQDDIAWLWIKPGFDITRLHSARALEIRNLSVTEYPWAVQTLDAALQQLFSGSDTSLTVAPAIVDLMPEARFFDRLFPTIIDYPYIEIELVFFEQNSHTILCKLCHFAKAEEFPDALQQLIADLQAFITARCE